jgi:hypothetical protein
MAERRTLTPPELAASWGISADQVLRLIHAGALPAFNVAAPSSTRPKYLIRLQDVEAFEMAKRVGGPAPARKARRQKAKPGGERWPMGSI